MIANSICFSSVLFFLIDIGTFWLARANGWQNLNALAQQLAPVAVVVMIVTVFIAEAWRQKDLTPAQREMEDTEAPEDMNVW
jgi:hypothetical protein